MDALPGNPDGISVENGTLRVDVAADAESAADISGSGMLRFVGSGEAVESAHVFDKYVTTANQTLIENADVFDIEITSAVFNGGWCGRAEGAVPYNVTKDETAQTMTVQLQKLFSNGALRGVVVRLAQDGNDVVVKGITARQAATGEGQTIGSDVTGWTAANPGIATSASANGYGLESIAFTKRAPAQIVLRGGKRWTGGLVADGCRVKILDSQLAAGTAAYAVNGGTVDLAARGEWNLFPKNVYAAEAGSTIIVNASFAVNQYDTVLAHGGTVLHSGTLDNMYINLAVFSGGAEFSGLKTGVGLDSDATWRTQGEGEVEIRAVVRTTGKRLFTLDTAADIAFREEVLEHIQYPGMSITKRGAAKAEFAAGLQSTGTLTLEAGTLGVGADSSLGPLALAGDAALEVAQGATTAFAASGGKAWTAGATLDIATAGGERAYEVRFGTDASGLDAGQLAQVRMNGRKCKIDENGWLRMARLATVIVVR